MRLGIQPNNLSLILELRKSEMDARPATSCHCWFKSGCKIPDLETGFVLENSCIAQERHPCTYFSLIAYQGSKSGGYGGNSNFRSITCFTLRAEINIILIISSLDMII